MLTFSDLLFTSILPLILGLSLAVFLSHLVQTTWAPAMGAWATLVTGYLGRFAIMDFAYADGETVTQKVVQSLSQTATGLLSPPTAIQWIPIFATAVLATTVIVERVGPIGSSKQPDGSLSHHFLSRALIYGLLVTLSATAVVRLLWTSVYFADPFPWTVKLGYVAVPAILISAVWFGAFSAASIGCKTSCQYISRWASVSTMLLSASALVLLASSGSFTIGLLQIPALSAAVVVAVLHQPTTERYAVGGDIWLIVSAVCFPVAIGFFFAEVRWEAAVLFASSAILVAWMPPRTRNSNLQKVCKVVVSCLPAIAAAVWAATLLSQTIESTYGGYQ